jgi:amino acid adenylation domain-containing protein/non-ribosomal peptide synthase protein (TIGR01720 family)
VNHTLIESIAGQGFSPRQRRISRLHREGALRSCDTRALLRLRGPLDADSLARAVQRLAARHEVLGAGLRWEEAEDLCALPAAEREARVEEAWSSGAGELPTARLLRVERDEHLLLLRMSSLGADEASTHHLARELAALYAAGPEGEPFEEEPVSYAAVAEWLDELLASEEARPGRAYWLGQCDGEEPALPWEPEAAAGAPSRARTELPAGTGAAVEALAERTGTSPRTVLLAGWKALLHRLGGTAAVRVGVAFDGRGDDALQGAVGPFTQPLPLTTAAGPQVPFAALVERVFRAEEDAAGWQECFDAEAVDRALAAEGGSLRLRAGFTLLPAPEALAAGDVEVLAVRCEAAGDPFTLYLRVQPAEDGLSLELVGGPGFSPELLQRVLAAYSALLDGALARPEAALAELPAMGAAERALVLEGFNRTSARCEPREWTIGALFEAMAARTPDAPAVHGAGETVAYGELDRRANRRARQLRALGVGPETRVGIMLPPTPARVEAVLAVLKAGGAYVPLDPAYPQDRLAFMVRDAGLRLVLADAGLRGRVPEVEGVSVLAWDETAAEAAALPEDGPGAALDPASAAYVIYTSGSTGTPKGVLVEHRALVAHALSVQAHYGLSPEDRILQFASFNFDASIEQLLPPLLSGACVVLRNEEIPSIEAIGRYVEEHRLTILNPPTAQWNLLADEWARGEAVPDTSSLRLVIAGGEAMLPGYVARWRQGPARGARLLNAYGPTETVITAATHDVPDGFGEGGEPRVPIGRPFGNRGAYVLDDRMEPVPVGAPGELFLGGDPLARGYLGRPGLTAERFVPDAFSGRPGARLYRTGDRVRWLEDGTLEFLGRADEQVKVRGFRIELGEIEATLMRHPAVREAAAVVREDARGERRLVGYVAAGGGEALAGELRAHLQECLPEYMVPSALVVLAALPLTPAGKVDRRALPAPEWRGGDGYAAPRTPLEGKLAAIWSRLLGVERVGIHDSFFELGGDSILSIQVVARARSAGVHLTPRQIFDRPTIAELAAVCGSAGSEVQAEQGAVAGDVELTPIQAWFLGGEARDRHHFNMSQLFEVRRPLDGCVLERAFARLVEHHDALRTRFHREGAGWRQEVPSEARPEFTLVDLSGLEHARRRDALEHTAARMQTGLRLDGPLLRVAYFPGDEERTGRLLVVVHHLVVDAVSWRVLLEDLRSACQQAGRGEEIRFPEKTTSFRRWAARLAEHTRRGGFDAELPYWEAEARRGIAPLPADFPRGAQPAPLSSTRSVAVALTEEETTALLQDVPRAYRTRINDALLAALARAVAAWTGETRLLVDLEGHGREDLFADVDTSRTVGWFTTVYPVLLDISAAPGAAGSLKAAKEQLRAVPNRGIGYGALRHLGSAQARAALASLPEAELRFEYLGQFDQSLSRESLFARARESAGALVSPRSPRTHRLAVSGGVLGGRLQMAWGYARTEYRRETVEALAERFAEELRGLIAHCTGEGAGGYTPSDFPLAGLGQEALDRALAGRGEVEDVYPLSPMQEGMLFHTLYAPGEGAYVGQFGFDLVGELDHAAFERAWQEVLERHPALRTAFVWEEVDAPVQVVQRRAALSIHREDWRGLEPHEQEARRAAFAAADRARGFAPGEAPLMRLALFRTADDRHHLLCTQHHLVMDGWSFPIVFGDVAALYGARSGGAARQLPPARPYRGYVAWLATRRPGAAEAFWRGALAGLETPTRLELDSAPAGGEGFAQETLRISPEATARLEAAGRRHGITVNTLVQGAWALLLSRYSGEGTVAFGATLSGRPAEVEGVEEIVGLFINTLPVCVGVRPEERVLPWLRGVQELNLSIREHEHTPLAEVQRWSGVVAGEPLFETLLVFENYPVGDSLGGGESALRVVRGEVVERSSYPFTLAVALGRGLSLRADYQRSRFGAETVRRMLGHLARALEAFASDPDQALGDVPLLGAEERGRLLAEWNAAPAPAAPACVHRLVSEQAARMPHAPAVLYGAESVSYGELEARSNRLAALLRRRGTGPEVPVGVCLERSPDLLVAVLGVLKAGGAYVPLDPAYPADRLAYTLRDSGARLLLTRAELAGRLPDTGAEVLALEAEAERIARESAAAPEGGAGPENLAYVIYTSGSTGRPKGVRVEHRSLAATLLRAREAFAFGPGDEMPCLASYAFDIWLFETFLPLLDGAAVRVVPAERVPDVPALLAEIREATALHAVPALMRQVMEQASAGVAELPRLRRVFVGGDAVSPELLERMRAAWPAADLRVLYGPTEGAIICASHAVREGGTARGQMVGRALGNAVLYVRDAAGGLAPQGAPGELCLRGACVARDYLGRPDLTAEKFVPDPFGTEPGARMYRTGDRVRWLPDGTLEFLGRTDQQVKIRGFRIEPGEIQAVLLREPGLRDALVVPREDAPGERRLVAYLVGEAVPAAGELRARLREVLPEYMVPAAFVRLDELPLSPNGKVDRRALPVPEAAGAERETVAPRDPVEALLAGIWSDVLGVETVGAHDGLFELGGHSLLAMRIASRVRAATGVEVPLAVLFTHPTVAELAGWMREARDGAAEPAPLARVGREHPLPLSFAQERLWFLDRAEDTGTGFTVRFGIRLEGESLDAEAMAGSFSRVIERHEVLRTVFPEVDGAGRQVVLPAAPFDLPLVDLQAEPAETREGAVARLAAAEAARPFDLERGPLLRALLLRLSETEHVLLVNLHHIVFDGWSTALLVGELTGCYAALRTGREPALPELAVQYGDYAAWEREWLRSEAVQDKLGYWREHLAGVPRLDLSGGRPRSERPSYRGNRLPVRLGAELSAAVRSMAREQRVTPFMLLLAAFKVVLAHHGRTRDLAVGTDVAGRTRVELEPLIGFFLNELVLRTDLSGDPSFVELLQRVRGVTVDAYLRQDVPFALVVKEAAGRRIAGTNPLFQVMFGLHNTEGAELAVDGLRVTPLDSASEASNWDLSLYMTDAAQGISGYLTYRTDLFESVAVEDLRADFLAVLEAVRREPGVRMEALAEQLAVDASERWAERASAAEEAGRRRLKGIRRRAIATDTH